MDGHDPEKWNDLPIRYLQELYPIQDNLMTTLDLSADQIEFATYSGTEELTYEVLAETETGIERWTYKASYSKDLIYPPIQEWARFIRRRVEFK